MNRVSLVFASIVFMSTFSNSVAQEPDDDFPFVGEYHGSISTEHGVTRVGLQAVALGDGEFTGMLYAGGLPGSGWNRRDRWNVTGSRADESLNLVSDNGLSIEIKGVVASVRAADASVLGTLHKVIRTSATLGSPPPENSIVLFDGHGTRAFKNGKVDDEGNLQVGTELLPRYGDFTLHFEFRIPYYPKRRSQNRGNSGLYINSRYEIQILDSFGLEGKPNECGGIYRQKAADQNMALPPLSWQTYDIRFRSPQFDATGNKVANARITVYHNNVPIHDDYAIVAKTGAGKPEGAELLPTKLQDHGSDVDFRNIWLIDHRRSSARSGFEDCEIWPLAGDPSPVSTFVSDYGCVK